MKHSKTTSGEPSSAQGLFPAQSSESPTLDTLQVVSFLNNIFCVPLIQPSNNSTFSLSVVNNLAPSTSIICYCPFGASLVFPTEYNLLLVEP